jgi:PhnB protein
MSAYHPELDFLILFNPRSKAFKFYEQCLGGKITAMMTYGESPPESSMTDQVPPEWRDKIMHVELMIGDQELMGSDSPPEYHEEPKGFSVSISLNNPAEAERIFHTLVEKGAVQMPFQQTFWAYRFGMLVDQFGIPWMINCEQTA